MDLMAFYIRKPLWLVELGESICSKVGDELKVENINPAELKGSMIEIPDDVFDDEDEDCLETGDTGDQHNYKHQ